jgi:hypothetical protein
VLNWSDQPDGDLICSCVITQKLTQQTVNLSTPYLYHAGDSALAQFAIYRLLPGVFDKVAFSLSVDPDYFPP